MQIEPTSLMTVIDNDKWRLYHSGQPFTIQDIALAIDYYHTLKGVWPKALHAEVSNGR